jgi:outer membrane cobalamin receptor
VPTFVTDIVVTPGRGTDLRQQIPAASSTLSREEIAAVPTLDAGGLLAALPGIHALLSSDVAGAPLLSSRGFFGGGEAEYVRVLINGVPVGDAESGLAEWRTVSAADIDRIEVLRGPGSSLYGDTSLGGVVQIFTAAREPWVQGSGGTSRFGRLDAAASPAFRGVSTAVSGSLLRTGGFRTHSAQRLEAARASIQDGGAPHGWRLAFSADRTRRDEPGALSESALATERSGSSSAFRFDTSNTRRGRVAGAYRKLTSLASAEARAHVAGRRADRLRTVLLAPDVPDRSLQALRTWTVAASGDVELPTALGIPRSRIRLGVDTSHDRLRTVYASVDAVGQRGAQIADAEGTRNGLGLFGTYTWTPVDRLRLTIGGRWDRIADRFASAHVSHQAWSPRAGLNVLVSDSHRLNAFAQVSRAFKAATLDQMFDPRPFPGFDESAFRISNPQLHPERAANIEGGLIQALRWVTWDLTAYRMTVTDEIDFDLATFRYGNIGASRHGGVELTARSTSLRRVSPTLFYAWTVVSPRSGPYTNRQLKNIPRHVIRPAVTVRVPRDVSVTARYTAALGRFLDDENTLALRPARSLDVRVNRTFSRARAFVDFTNLTNARVEEYGYVLFDPVGRAIPFYYPGAGFNARVGIELKLAAGGTP